jgi:serine/threonine protein kinase
MSVSKSIGNLFRYELLAEKPVHRGGCGHIWKARDLLYDRVVALKTIDEPLIWKSRETAQRAFRKEAMACARLSELTPYVVRVFDIGMADATLFYAMDWIEPEPGFHSIDLTERTGRLSLAAAKGVMLQTCEAVGVAHAKGIVHSDIAPSNILYDHSNRIYKLADFGLLKIVEETLISAQSGSLLVGGRRDFFPSEVLSDVSKISYASDVYALAVTFRVLVEGLACLPANGGTLIPTPGVLRVLYEQRDAPDQFRQLLARFIDGHRQDDTVNEFLAYLHRIPN